MIRESGEGATNTGYAAVVANPDGSPARASRINRGEAEFLARAGMLVISVSRHRDEYNTRVERVLPSLEDTEEVSYEERPVEGGFSAWVGGEHVADNVEEGGEWRWTNVDRPMILAALRAAWDKSRHYHCRCIHYAASSSAPAR